MANILVIDGSAFWRDLAADGLRLKGLNVTTAEDATTASPKLKKDHIDLIILEANLSGVQGLDLVEQLRAQPQWKNLPVIILTGEMHKEQVIRAKQLGVMDYILKTQFSLRELLERVERGLNPPSPASARPAVEASQAPVVPKKLLTREQCLARAMHAIGARTLSGVVSQVIASASSPRTDMSDLAALVGRDPMLSARVVAAANRLENAADRRVVNTLMDAVRVVGSSTIRDIAASFWVYDAMPVPEPDGYNPIRCWQHSIAVARLCDRLAMEEYRPVAYLLGLCHDLGEILFRSHFGTEYRQLLEAQKQTGIPRPELEQLMLGITQSELVQSILKQLALPDAILQPIAAFHAAVDHGAVPTSAPARMLLIADAFSTALMLNSSDRLGVRPLNRVECKAATGVEDPPAIDWRLFRAEVSALTAECARLNAKDQADLIPKLPIRRLTKVWLARDSAFSTFDPVATALESMVELSVHNRLPNPTELIALSGIIVLTRSAFTHGLTFDEVLLNCANRPDGSKRSILYLTGKSPTGIENPAVSVASWPIPMNKLAEFVGGLK